MSTKDLTLSVLNSVKKTIGGIDANSSHFDADLIIHINSVFGILSQLGVGPVGTGFTIKSQYDLWTDFLPEGDKLEFVKTYMYLKVKLIFDPPASSSTLSAMERQISELEWRISVSN